jgi:hypothetical protein
MPDSHARNWRRFTRLFRASAAACGRYDAYCAIFRLKEDSAIRTFPPFRTIA